MSPEALPSFFPPLICCFFLQTTPAPALAGSHAQVFPDQLYGKYGKGWLAKCLMVMPGKWCGWQGGGGLVSKDGLTGEWMDGQ